MDFEFLFLGTSLGKAPGGLKAPQWPHPSPAGPSCICWKPQIPCPGHLGSHSWFLPSSLGLLHLCDSLITAVGCSSANGILLLSVFLSNCTAETPEPPKISESFIWDGNFFFSGFGFKFFAKKLQKTQFLSSQPQIFLQFSQPALLQSPSPVNPWIIPPSPHN